ncbi:MAG: exonuclease SbcCD subunit D [Cyanobacteriota bacterium]|jgi:DNA repair exonuclease SbcCD nuclease subunit
MPTFLHTADWQIGKPYARVTDPDKRSRLRQVRLEAIERIGATAAGASFLVVAGDLFDSPTPARSDVSAVCAAIGRLELPVLVIPGNHDHGAPGSVWHSEAFRAERERRAPNLQLLLERKPVELAEAVVLPCPLLRRIDSADPCAWLQQLAWSELPAGKARIVLAHGAVQDFRPGDLDPLASAHPSPRGARVNAQAGAGNRLRLEADWLAEVDYVALGDWHGLQQVGPSVWYSGTPEPDRFPRSDDYRAGKVLQVSVERGSPPSVTPLATGQIRWHPLRFHCRNEEDLPRLEQQIDALLGERVGSDLLLLELEGSLSLSGQERLQQLLERLRAQLLRLKLRGGCALMPAPAELAALTERPGDPLVARVALRLQEQLILSDQHRDRDADGDGISDGLSEATVLRQALVALHRLVREAA